jgi:hypothetical protein
LGRRIWARFVVFIAAFAVFYALAWALGLLS